MAATQRPAPYIPDLGPDNTLDLDRLGSADLKTWINYPGIAEGDCFWLGWWGCSALGKAVDEFDNLIKIQPGELQPEGRLVSISNDKLRDLNQGYVFYSTSKYDEDKPDKPGEESLRLFFKVGKRPYTSPLLPVPQFKQSHALAVDLEAIGPGGATVVTARYQAMSPGDVVTLILKLYFGEDDYWETFDFPKDISEDDIGKPVTWTISKNLFEVIVDGFAQMSYCIDYATPTVPSCSATQTVHVIAPPDTRLPAPIVVGYDDGGELDPDLYLDGLPVCVPMFDGARAGDYVVVYAEGDTSLTKTLRVDPSTIDSRVIEVNLERAWLTANQNSTIRLMYQHARMGNAGTSRPLTLKLSKPLKLPFAIVETVTDGGEGKGYLLANRITGGVYIQVPEEADIGVGKQVQMHWKGYGATGSHIADPMSGNANRYYIPTKAIPANMGKHLEVFYKVTPPGKDSQVFDLEIRNMTTGWPTVQIENPDSPGNKVSLAAATNGVHFLLKSWTYMWSGQHVKIEVEGLLKGGGKETFPVRTGSNEVVTEDENDAGELRAILPRDFLERLELYEQFNVLVCTSFDGGHTYKQFPHIEPQLIP
ncbi:hypothetical protein ACW9HW_12205 [Pseudomonas sp. SDO5532_S415]